jgi:hypothetical protein
MRHHPATVHAIPAPCTGSPLRPALRAVLRAAAAVFALALFAVAPASAGGISGTVRGPSGEPVQTAVAVYSARVGNPLGALVTDAAGDYSFQGLSPGTYFVHAFPPASNPQRLTGELYAEVPSNDLCGARGTEVPVGTGTTTGIDFTLQVGATITGTLTSATNGSPIGGTVYAVDLRGCGAGGFPADSAGAYEVHSVPPGRYYLTGLAPFDGLDRADVLHPALPCAQGQCNVFAGTPVATGSTVHLTLPDGVGVSGRIDGPDDLPLSGVEVSLWRNGERLAWRFTHTDGLYQFTGVSAASGYRIVAKKQGFVTEVWPNTPCPNVSCNVGSAGTAVDLPTPGTAAVGRNLKLEPGFSISGALSPSGPAHVDVYTSTGLAGTAYVNTSYSIGDLPNGTYFVKARMPARVTEYWDDRPCPANLLCIPDGVTIAGANRTGIDFTLGLAHRIHGTVKSPTGDPVGGVTVEVYDGDGWLMSTAMTDVDGLYATESEGLPPGTYYVRTRVPRRLHQFGDALFEGRPCGPGCNPATGKPVPVTAAGDTTGVDLTLPFSGTHFFTLKPCRIYDSRSVGSTIASGVLVALRVEGLCEIPPGRSPRT